MLYLILGLELEPLELLAVVIAYFFAICIAMSFHEFAHAFTAHKCGDLTPKATGRLTLNPFAHFSGLGLLMFFLVGFGWAKPVQINPIRFKHYRKGMFWTSISGVLTNLALAFVFSGLYILFLVSILNFGWDINNLLVLFFEYFFYFSLTINLVLFIFNLLPIPPLDGYNVISIYTKYNNKLMLWLERYGFFVIIFLVLPIFGGKSILEMFYDVIIPAIENVFFSFWSLFI